MSNTKFKVGDRVFFNSPTPPSRTRPPNGEHTIAAKSNYGYYLEGYPTYDMDDTRLTLVKAVENKFKVGDRVFFKHLFRYTNPDRPPEGEHTIMSELKPGAFILEGYPNWSISPDKFTLVQPKFKRGQYVYNLTGAGPYRVHEFDYTVPGRPLIMLLGKWSPADVYRAETNEERDIRRSKDQSLQAYQRSLDSLERMALERDERKDARPFGVVSREPLTGTLLNEIRSKDGHLIVEFRIPSDPERRKGFARDALTAAMKLIEAAQRTQS